ncbi:MAG: RNA polymerase sigma factor [bacterium]|nr:RNA polymerase sigma factor [bacterium]
MNRSRTISAGDKSLIASVVRTGDQRAFRTLYRRHTPHLFQLVLRITGGSRHEAEDVVQETWVRACSRLPSFRGESVFSTWLFAVGVNVSRDRLRQRSRCTLFDLDENALPLVQPGQIRDRIDLERAIALLPDGYRLVLVLHDIEGWKHREIAEELDISEGTSKSQLYNARRTLRKILRPAGDGDHECQQHR